MEITIIIGLVLFLVCVFLAIKLIKNLLLSIGTILLLSLIFIAGTGFFLYTEAMDIKDNFPTSVNQFLLVDGDDILTGMVLLPSDKFNPMESLKPLPSEKEADLKSHFKTNEYNLMLSDITQSDFNLTGYNENSYLTVFIDMSVVENSPMNSFDLSAIMDDPALNSVGALDKDFIINLLRSEDAWDYLTSYLVDNMTFDIDSFLAASGNDNPLDFILPEDVELTVEQKTQLVEEKIIPVLKSALRGSLGTTDLKPVVFMLFMGGTATHDEGLKYMFLQYKAENMYVYPQNIIFDIFRLSPASLFNKVLENAKGAIGEIIS